MKNSNDIFAGILIGFFITMILVFIFKDNKEPTWWCVYLSKSEASYCNSLYDKAVKNIDKMPEEEYPPMPL